MMRENAKLSFEIVQKNLSAILKNDAVWTSTRDKPENGSFLCLQTNSDCRGAGGTFSIYLPDGSLFYDPSEADTGFGLDSNPCSSFDVASGNHSSMEVVLASI